MIKGAIKRMGSMLLALLLVLSMVPLSAMPVQAASSLSLADLDIGVSWNDDGTWASLSGNSIKGSVTGKDGGTCGSDSASSTKLIITNQKDTSATLSFDYKLQLNDGSVVIDGANCTSAGTFSKKLASNKSISIQLTSAEGEKKTEITIENIFLYASGTYEVFFSPAEGGTYTVDEEAVPKTGLKKENESSHAYALVATAASNYKFLGWKDENNTVLSTDASTTIHFDENTTVTPWFVPEDTAVFSVDESYYVDLNEAVEKAQESATKLVSVEMSGTLVPGNYTIPSGITLVIPYNSENTIPAPATDTENPYALANWVTSATFASGSENAYRTLTISQGSTLSVEGTIVTGGTIMSNSNIPAGGTSTQFSRLQVEGSLSIENGGVLSSCGFVSGGGNVVVKNDGAVYQPFVVMDFCGGGYTVTAAAGASNASGFGMPTKSGESAVSPFLRWAMPNVQSNITYEYGSALFGYADLYANDQHNKTTAQIIGTDSGILQLSENSSIVCSYDPTCSVTTQNEKATGASQAMAKVGKTAITTNGNVEFGNMVLEITAIVTAVIDTGNLTFPVPYLFDVVVQTGTLSLNHDVALLPGASLEVKQDAALNIPADAKLTVYPALFDQKKTGSRSHYTVGQKDYAAIGGYPTTADLQNASMSGSAELIVDGDMRLDGSFGGLIQTNGTGSILVGNGAKLETTTQIGAIGALIGYYNAGATVHTIPAQIYSPVERTLVGLQPGEYSGKAINAYFLPDYTYQVYTDTNDVDKVFDNTLASVQPNAKQRTGTGAFYTLPVSAYSISVNSINHKTEYKVGDSLDVTGLSILVINNDGSQETVSVTSDMVSGFDSSAVVEKQTLTITYGGKTATYDISIDRADGLEIAETLAGVKPSLPGEEDGKITGLDANKSYEYRPVADPEVAWKPVTPGATEISDLAAGIYEVRYAETDTHTAGPIEKVTVPEGEATVTIVDGGTGATGSGSYKQGVAVTINAGTKTGCVFEKWTADSADVTFTNAEATETTFTMPDHNVTITAIWHCHKDNATKNEGKAATCTEAGTREYYTCTCGMNFEDADCTKEIQDDIDTWKIIPELGHSYGPPTFKWSQDYKSCTVVFDCTRDGCSSQQESNATVDSRTDTPASCEQMGSTSYTASVTFQEEEYQDTKTVQDIPATGHNWKPQYNWSEDLQSCSVMFTCQNDSSHTHTQNAEVTSEITIPATCTAMGTTAYTAAVTFEGKAYEDIQTKEDIPMIPHAYSDAWQFDGEKHWKECTACKTPAEEGAHTFQWIVDKPATEDETGLKHEECTMCHYERNEDTPIDKLDHIHTGITHHAAVPSTCSVQGTVEYWTCSSEKCQGKYYGDEDCQVILTSIEAELDPNNHVGETERRNAIEATCTQSGYTGDLYCLACDSLISKGESIPVKDHTYRNEWSMDAENHWKVCSICEAPGEKVEHIFTNEGDLICNECGYQRKPVLATELAISAEPDTLTGGGNVILKVTGVPEGQAVKVTCDDSEIIVTQTESVWTASLPNVSKEYTFTATSSADGETTGTAACKIEVTAYSGGGGGTPSTPSEPEEPTWPFEDVTEGDDWFYDAVAYVYENGIMAGTDETVFEPTMELNRAQAAQLFYNLEGQPAVTDDTDFTDVTSGHWAVDAITWAAQNNVVAGIGEGLYDPDSNVTREQFAQMLYNYAKYKGYDLTASGDLTQFPDAGSISSWAETALSWANGKGLINGHEDGTIDHQGSTIRAQAASIMANFDQNVVK